MNDNEDNQLLGRVKRYASVSGQATRLAFDILGERLLGRTLVPDDHATALTTALGGLKGPVMKIAQILAMVPDLLPDTYAKQLQQLQSEAPAMGWTFVKRRMQGELGPNWEARFKSFERHATKAASLGQVHKAEALTGDILACKLQYPDMKTIVQADLNQLKLLLSLYRKWQPAIDTGEIEKEIVERIFEELDYKREARHIRAYQHMLAGHPNIHVPTVYDDLSTDRLLTMNWLEGQSLWDMVDAPQTQKNQIATNLFIGWYKPFYHYGILHGDPHMGNYTICTDGSLNLLDFGSVRVFPSQFVEGVIELYQALLRDDYDRTIGAYEQWGFTNLTKPLVDALNTWARFLYGPLMEDKTRYLHDDRSNIYGKEVAASVYSALKDLGGVKPPRAFVLMDRAAVGLGSAFIHLNAKLNWHRLFNDLIEGFDADKLTQRQLSVLEIPHDPQ